MRFAISCILLLTIASVPAVSSIVSADDNAGDYSGQGGCGNPPDGTGLFSESPAAGVRIVREEDYPKRPSHYLSSNLYTSLACGRETGDRFVAFDFKVAPVIGGPEDHHHHNEWETFFVEQADITFTHEENNMLYHTVAPPGTLVYGSQGPVHGFKNHTDKPGRIFSFAMPAGLDNFFETSGEFVADYDALVPPISEEEIFRTAFWAEQRGDALQLPGEPLPVIPPDTPKSQITSIYDKNRRHYTGPFGEKRVSLLTPTEAGHITGATAFCGPGTPQPREHGGTVNYSYLSLPSPCPHFPPSVTSENTEVYYTLHGNLSFKFNSTKVTVPARTYVEIQPDVPYSIRNEQAEPADSLNVSVIAPQCPH
jgi:mannose-6-phosphate isomerase-like protein (cupin superfamily)